MRLFYYFYQEDFGHELYLNIFVFRRFNIFQLELMWDDFPTWIPYLTLSFLGHYGSLIGVTFGFGKFRFSFDFLAYQPKDLNYLRKCYGKN